MISTMIWSYLVVALICDLKSYRIPNELIGLGYVAGCFFNILSLGPKGFLVFGVNVLWPIATLYVFFLIRALGAGDIKLFSVLATVVGAKDLLMIIALSLIFGAIVGITRIIKRRKVLELSHMHFSICIAASFVINYLWR